MQQLSGQDASFLYLETNRSPMHIGALQIYDQSTVKGGVQGFKNILRQIEQRLHLARTFRQKVVGVPLNLDHPYWIEDRNFDLEYHVRHIALPQPGDWRQLCIQAARLHSRPLDLAKPLWELTVIEGLDGVAELPKGCYAVMTKVHHACVDGVSGIDMVNAVHDLEPYPPSQAGPDVPWRGETPPDPLELLARASLNNAFRPLRWAELAARTVPALGRLSERSSTRRFISTRPVPRTRFSNTVTGHRVFEGRRFDLAEIRAIAHAVEGATVNDVVLAICGGALRRYLAAWNELPELPLIAVAPISVRGAEDHGSLGNQVSAMSVAIGTHIADPLQRLRAVHDQAAASKAMTNTLGAKLLTDYSRAVPSTSVALAARLYTRLGIANRTAPLFNCVVTNVPGPQFPLYSAGAKLVAQYGMGPILDGVGLILPVLSYDGALAISVTSCREMMPDPQFFAECLEAGFAELRQAAAAR